MKGFMVILQLTAFMASACALNTGGRYMGPLTDASGDPVEDSDMTVESEDETGDEPLPDVEPPEDMVEEELEPGCRPEACPLGCHPEGTRCYRLDASNVDEFVFYHSITGGLELASGEVVTVNTDSGEVRGMVEYRPADRAGETLGGVFWDTYAQAGGGFVSVFAMEHLIVPASARILVSGSMSVLFYVTNDVRLDGVIEATALGSSPGPGGSAGGASNGAPGAGCGIDSHGKGGSQGDSSAGEVEAGGGGGGGGGQGGDGGIAEGYSNYPGGAGGIPMGSEALIPLSGGCGGGAGGGPDSAGGNGGYGGGGGGGVQISAGGTITIGVSGGINVPGAGGQCGLYGAGGGGGGSGGAILLEAASILSNGLLAANGGGGGSGGVDIYTACGENGHDGQFSTIRSPGGTGLQYGGDGGMGGGAESLSGDTAPRDYNGGGGGGASGRIRINYHDTIDEGNHSPYTISVNHSVLLW